MRWYNNRYVMLLDLVSLMILIFFTNDNYM